MDWTREEKDFLNKLNNPDKIQTFLDSIEYNPDYTSRSPRYVIRTRSAHCFEGALFAAAALENTGHRPLIVDMLAEDDDDHVIAVFKVKGHWGAVAKSNFTSLRFREPVYRSVRELVMSYFDFFFNTDRFKSLRSYSLPFDLGMYESRKWKTTEEDLEYIGEKIESLHHFPVVTEEMIRNLSRASETMLNAGLLGSRADGLFRPGTKKAGT